MSIKRDVLVSCFIALFLLLPAALYADEATQNLDTRVLETFDENALSRWIAIGSKFATREKDASGKEIVYPLLKEVSTYPEAFFGTKAADNSTKKALGILGKFSRQGYNYIEIVPVKEADAQVTEKDIIYIDPNQGKKFQPNPIIMPGRIKLFDVWVWGANYNFYLEAHFEDSWGMPHVLYLGNLHFRGWKNLSANFPTSIRQSSEYLPRFRPLKFTKFVLWTQPNEQVGEFYVYLDHVKVLTDIFEQRFDGDVLADPEFTNEIWGTGTGTAQQ